MREGGFCTWVKTRTICLFFVLCFLALGGHCVQMLCSRGFGTHANTQNLPHFRVLPASIREPSPPQNAFFPGKRETAKSSQFALPPIRSLVQSRSPALPNISTSFRSKTLKMGTPNCENWDGPGNSTKFWVSVEFPRKPVVWVIPGNSF